MKFTLEILNFKLRQRFRVCCSGKYRGKYEIERVRLWDGEGNDPHVLYIYSPALTAFPGPKDGKRLLLQVLGETRTGSSEGYCLYYKEGGMWEAVNGVLQALPEFILWRDQLADCCRGQFEFRRFVTLLSEYLQVDLSLIDYNFCKLAVHCVDPGTPWPELFFSEGDMDLASVQQLSLDCPDIEETFSTVGLCASPPGLERGQALLYFYNMI